MPEVWGELDNSQRTQATRYVPGREIGLEDSRLTVGSETEKFIELVEINATLL